MALKTGFIYTGARSYLVFHSVACPLLIDVLNLYESLEKSFFTFYFIDVFVFFIYFAQEVTPGSFAPLLCVFRRHQSRHSHHLPRSGEHRRGHNQSHQVALITGPPTAADLSPPPAEMSAGALCLWLVLALRQGCVTPLAIPQERRPEGPQGRPESIMNAASIKQEAQFHLRDLPRGPAVAPHKKPPQFMLDFFNVVSVSHGTLKSQKEILDGSVVRSFEDKGKKKNIILYIIIYFVFSYNAFNFQLRTITHAERTPRAQSTLGFYVGIISLFSKCVFGALLFAGHAGERFHFFNLSSFGREERMIKAEFRWFRKKQKIYLGKFYVPHFCKVSSDIS